MKKNNNKNSYNNYKKKYKNFLWITKELKLNMKMLFKPIIKELHR